MGTPSDNSDTEAGGMEEDTYSDSEVKNGLGQSNVTSDQSDQSEQSEQSDQSDHSDNEQSAQSSAESEQSDEDYESYDEGEATTVGHKLDDDEAFALQLLTGKK